MLVDLSWRAWRTVDCIDSTVRVIAFRPLSVLSSVLMPFDIASSSALRSPARAFSETEVKKFDGLSSAELTFLPVASRFCVVLIISAVFCSDKRFCRTPAERTTSLMAQGPNRIARRTPFARSRHNLVLTLMFGKCRGRPVNLLADRHFLTGRRRPPGPIA